MVYIKGDIPRECIDPTQIFDIKKVRSSQNLIRYHRKNAGALHSVVCTCVRTTNIYVGITRRGIVVVDHARERLLQKVLKI